MNLKIVTPEGEILQKTIDSVTIPTQMGEITVLKNHIPLFSALIPGELVARKDNREEYFSISTGFVEVLPNSVTILADTAETAESLLEEKILEAKEKAQLLLEEKRKVSDVEYAAAAALLERELARLKVVRRRKR